MKKLFCAIVASTILATAASCSAPADKKSDFFDEAGTAILTGECNGAALTLKVDYPGTEADGEVHITVIAPEALSGTELIVGSGGTYCMAGDLNIPLSEGAAAGIMPLAEAMRISTDDIISAEPDHVSARRGDTDYYVTLGEGGKPARISWSGGDFEIAPAMAD